MYNCNNCHCEIPAGAAFMSLNLHHEHFVGDVIEVIDAAWKALVCHDCAELVSVAVRGTDGRCLAEFWMAPNAPTAGAQTEL